MIAASAERGQLINSFSDILTRISALGREADIQIEPFTSPDLPYFSVLPAAMKSSAFHAAKAYLEICENTKLAGGIKDSKIFVWQGIKSLGLRPTSDFFNYLSDDSVVEVHDFHARQLFRNLTYFRYSSYDLESLFCRDIHQLFSYDKSAIEYLLTWFEEIKSGQWPGMKPFNLPTTPICEIASPLKYELSVEFQYGGPLFDRDGRPAATISIEKAKIENIPMSAYGEEKAFLEHAPSLGPA